MVVETVLTRVASDSRKAWCVVALLWFVALLNYLDRLMIVSMRDSIKASITMTDAQFGLLTAAFLWTYGLLSPLGGYMADCFGRSKVIFGSLLVWSLVTGACSFAHTFPQLVALRALMGISEACYIPAALALIADYHPGKTRSLATGIHMSGIYLGAVLGGAGGFVAEYTGWRAGFLLFGIIGASYALFLGLCLRDVRKLNDDTSKETFIGRINLLPALQFLFASMEFWLLFGASAIVGMTNWYINGWLPAYLQNHFGLGAGGAGLSATGYVQIAAFPGVIAGGILADRWNRVSPQGRSYVTSIGFAVAGPCLFVAASASLLSMAIIALAFFGFWKSFIDANLMPVLRQVTCDRFSATGYGILNCVGCVAGGLMVYAGGVARDANFSSAGLFEILAAALLVASFLFLAVGHCIGEGFRRRQTSA